MDFGDDSPSGSSTGSFAAKKSRLDSFTSRLAKTTRGGSWPKKCKSCGADTSESGDCEACWRKICPVCDKSLPRSTSTLPSCSTCKRGLHAECARDAQELDDYTCYKCRQSPIVGVDTMLSAPLPTSPLASASTSGQNTSSGFDQFEFTNSPGGDDSLSFSLLGNSTGGGGTDERMSVASSVRSSASSRNSPAFCPGNESPHSDDDDEFRPGRGNGSSRGGRAGKKKPGSRGGVSLMKTRSGGKPPSGLFLQQLGKGDRGPPKRATTTTSSGGRKGGATTGNKSNGKGSKGRGSNGGGNGGGGSAGRNGGGGSNGRNGRSGTLPTPLGLASHTGSMSSITSWTAARDSEDASRGSDSASRSAGGEVYRRTIVIVGEDDNFVINQPLCLWCGSIGRGSESSMVACASCAHTYHTYCTGLHDKMNSTIVEHGWRCLDCTVCEGCGSCNSEERMVMCVDCDVSYHLGCLDPPLPAGTSPGPNWRCKDCSKCRRCHQRVTTNDLSKEGLCPPCLSLRKCPKCSKLYDLGEAIIRCSACQRWYHGACEELHSEEALEAAALNKMRCRACRPQGARTGGPFGTSDSNQIVCDNVALNTCADEVLQSKMMPTLFRAQSFTNGTGGGMEDIKRELGAGFLSDYRSSSIDSHYGSVDDDAMDCGDDSLGPLSGMPPAGPGSRGGRGGGRGGSVANRGRMTKLGVGGFSVKIPRHRLLAELEESAVELDKDGNPKPKKPRKSRKSILEDAYPAVIQEGFFGMRAVDCKALADADITDPVLHGEYAQGRGARDAHRGDELSHEASESLRNHFNEEGVLENVNLNECFNDIDDFNFDNFDDLLGDVDDDDFTDAFDMIDKDGGGDVGGGGADTRSGSTTMGTPNYSNGPNQSPFPGQATPTQSMPLGGHPMTQTQPGMYPGEGPNSVMDVKPNPMQLHAAMQAGAGVGGGGHLNVKIEPGLMQIKQEPGHVHPPPGQISRANSSMDGPSSEKADKMNAAQMAELRWEEDEPLGDKATKAAVLYVNINQPDLKEKFPVWEERVKQIHKTWRNLESVERQKYVTQARHNRAQREKVPRPRGPRTTAAPVKPDGGLAMRLVGGSMSMDGVPGMPPPPPGGGPGGGPGGVHPHLHPMAMHPGYHGDPHAPGFKVPHTPMQGMPGGPPGPSSGGPPPPPAPFTVDHLAPELQAQYAALKEAVEKAAKEQKNGELEVNRLRKQKKNQNTKKRGIQRLEAQPDGTQVGPPLSEAEQEQVRVIEAQIQTLTDDIAIKAKNLEGFKKNNKAALSSVTTFEMQYKNHVDPAATSQSGLGSQLSGMGRGMGGPSGPYQQLTVPQQMSFSQMMGQQERAYALGGIHPRPGVGRGLGPFGVRPPSLMLGNVRYADVKTPDERDIYELLDTLVERVAFSFDGPPMPSPSPMNGGTSLKRLLEASTNGVAAGAPGAYGAAFSAAEEPKPKKKRIIQKKTGTPGGNEYESNHDRLKAELAKLDRIPRRNLEPVPKQDLAPCVGPQLSELGEKYERSQPRYSPFGAARLKFIEPDAYSDRWKVSSLLPGPVGMLRIAPHARLDILRHLARASSSSSSFSPGSSFAPPPPPPIASIPTIEKDSQDQSQPSTSQCHAQLGDSIRNLVPGVENGKSRALLRCSAPLPEQQQINEPHRNIFRQPKKEECEDYVIDLDVFDRGTAEGCVVDNSEAHAHALQLVLRLKDLLELKDEEVDGYHLDTPPLSPEQAMGDMKPILPSGVFGGPSCMGGGGSGMAKCRLCDRHTHASATIRQSMAQLGLTPSDDGKDDTVTFCTMKCYYMFVASSKVALSHDQLAAAEAHVDEATYCKLKQISADSFARCINQGQKLPHPPSIPDTRPPMAGAVAPWLASTAAAVAPTAQGVLPPAPVASSSSEPRPTQTVGQTVTALIQAGALVRGESVPPPPTPTTSGAPTGEVASPRAENKFSVLDDRPRPEFVHMMRCADLAAAVTDSGRRAAAPRAAGEDWKVYDNVVLSSFTDIPRQKQELAQKPKMGVHGPPIPCEDRRTCSLCGQVGDGSSHETGRLLNYDVSAWVHANCALWSQEVYETGTGALIGVDRALIRGTTVRCAVCNGVGATIQCYKVDCGKSFHMSCACRTYGHFVRDKTFLCPAHNDIHPDHMLNAAQREPLRRLYIERGDENKLIGRLFESLDAPRLVLRLGALTFLRLGQLLPDQFAHFHTQRCIYPIGYTVQRMFWSLFDPRKRVAYTCTIRDYDGHPLFAISSGELTAAGKAEVVGDTPFSAWKDIFEAIDSCRLSSRGTPQCGVLRRLRADTDTHTDGLWGLTESSVTKMTESLPGVETLYSYSFRHGGAAVLELPLAENPSGCARCEPRPRMHFKHHVKPSSSSGRTHGQPKKKQESGLSLYEELQAMMRASGYKGDGSQDKYGETEKRYSDYSKMRKEWRNTVYLARSKIQGLGLYAKRDIDMGSMIIEYKGEVIRSEVCEMREKRYFAQNRGTYMFRLNSELVVDATMKGGCARYVNHSCDPNCSTQIVNIGNDKNVEDKKIIITANRPIKADEELTYDYQFDIEDEGKVKCLCGAPNCGGWMN